MERGKRDLRRGSHKCFVKTLPISQAELYVERTAGNPTTAKRTQQRFQLLLILEDKVWNLSQAEGFTISTSNDCKGLVCCLLGIGCNLKLLFIDHNYYLEIKLGVICTLYK